MGTSISVEVDDTQDANEIEEILNKSIDLKSANKDKPKTNSDSEFKYDLNFRNGMEIFNLPEDDSRDNPNHNNYQITRHTTKSKTQIIENSESNLGLELKHQTLIISNQHSNPINNENIQDVKKTTTEKKRNNKQNIIDFKL